jgi:hypothetical protein
MLGLIKRSIKLDESTYGEISVHVNDVTSALSVSRSKLKELVASLERLGVGGVTDHGTSDRAEWHVWVRSPSDYLTWFDIDNFCRKTGHSLDEFVIHLKFGLLGS